MQSDCLVELSWRDVRTEVAKKNPEFAQIADQFNPQGDFKVYKARYPFGSRIIKHGVFHLPIDGTLKAINDPDIPARLRQQLHYNHDTAPLSMMLKRSAELSIYTENRLIPHFVLNAGSLFALWTILDPDVSYHNHNLWYLTAGAHNLFVVPKIKDFYAYKRLCHSRGIRLGLPNTLLEQHQLLMAMSQHADYPEWHCEILLFTAEWLKTHSDLNWHMFHHFLYKYAWIRSSYWRNTFSFYTTWDSFIRGCSRVRVKVTPRAADILKHLLATALGAVPGFAPALNDEQGPVAAWQKDFYEIYELDHYVATIMAPRHFSLTRPDQPVYWSFHLPSYFESISPKGEKTTLSLIHEVHELLVHFREMGLAGKLSGICNTPIETVLKQLQFNFYHSDQDARKITRPVHMLAQEDPSFLQCPQQYGIREISEMGPFRAGLCANQKNPLSGLTLDIIPSPLGGESAEGG